MARQDGSTFDLDATNAAARDDGPTRRTVNADGSVSQLAEESRDLSGDKARARTVELRREEAIPEVLREDRDLVQGYLAEIEAEIDEALANPEAYEAEQKAENAAFYAAIDTGDLYALTDVAAGEPDDDDDGGTSTDPDGPDDDDGGAAVTIGGSAGPDDYPPDADAEGSVVEVEQAEMVPALAGTGQGL